MILAAAFRVHSRLGPGLLESVYQRVLVYELTKGGLSVEVQKSIPIVYDELVFDEGYRADLIVENRVALAEVGRDLDLARLESPFLYSLAILLLG